MWTVDINYFTNEFLKDIDPISYKYCLNKSCYWNNKVPKKNSKNAPHKEIRTFNTSPCHTWSFVIPLKNNYLNKLYDGALTSIIYGMTNSIFWSDINERYFVCQSDGEGNALTHREVIIVNHKHFYAYYPDPLILSHHKKKKKLKTLQHIWSVPGLFKIYI